MKLLLPKRKANTGTGAVNSPGRRSSAYAIAMALTLGSVAGAITLGTGAYAAPAPVVYASNFSSTTNPHLYSCQGSVTVTVAVATAVTNCTAILGEIVGVGAIVQLYGWTGSYWHQFPPVGTQAHGTGSVTTTMSVPPGYSGYHASARHLMTHSSGEVLSNAYSTSASIVPSCYPASGGDLVTIADITAIFGAAYDTQVVRDGLPSLNAQMKAGGIDNPRRCAAFLATLKNESDLRYSAVQAGVSTYRGRGFMQLTGKANYSAAGSSLGHSFVTNPGDAATIAWSARVARWYWTVNRPGTNAAADNLDMGLISKYVGYGFSTPEDLERCADFKTALQHFTGSIPTGVNCLRPWTPLRMYQVGQQVSYDGLSYECLQQHISQTGVQPPNAPGLWKKL